MVTPGDVDDRKSLENKRFIEIIFDKLVADKGYMGAAAAYCYFPKKPSIQVVKVFDNQLTLF